MSSSKKIIQNISPPAEAIISPNFQLENSLSSSVLAEIEEFRKEKTKEYRETLNRYLNQAVPV